MGSYLNMVPAGVNLSDIHSHLLLHYFVAFPGNLFLPVMYNHKYGSVKLCCGLWHRYLYIVLAQSSFRLFTLLVCLVYLEV